MNGTMIQYFHWYTEGNGKLWEEVKNNAEYLADLGITMAWLPPAYKGNSGRHSVGYDPYDLVEVEEFDQEGGISTKYGNNKQYAEAVEALRKVNIGTIVDIVLNHKAGGDEKERFNVYKVDPHNSLKFLSAPLETPTHPPFNFP